MDRIARAEDPPVLVRATCIDEESASIAVFSEVRAIAESGAVRLANCNAVVVLASAVARLEGTEGGDESGVLLRDPGVRSLDLPVAPAGPKALPVKPPRIGNP